MNFDFRARWVKFAAAAAIVLLLVVILAGRWNGTRNALIDRETALNAQYLDNQNELDAFLKKAHETFNVADAKADRLDQILTDAVKGRYEGETGANPTGGAFFSAITEAYPDLQGLDTFDRVATVVEAGREAYKQKQTKLLDMLRDYDSYRKKGLLHSFLVGRVGYPTLEARIGTKVVTGAAAREQMYLIVTRDATSEAYNTGKQDPLDFGDE